MNTIRNYVTLVGNIGTPAKITKFDDGKSVARFSLATQKVSRNNDGKYTAKIQWHRVMLGVIWQASLRNMLKKGKRLPFMAAL